MPDVSRARVLIVGAGGLGCPASLVLARAGVGALTLADPDTVDVTNLHRQLWHMEADVGRAKVDSAAEKLERAFPSTKVARLCERITAANVERLFLEHDLVIDGTDGINVKFLLSDAAVRTKRTLIYGGVLRMQGQVMPIVPGGPCLRCLFETPPAEDEVPTCAQAGVLGSMAGVIGAWQAQLAVGLLGGCVPQTGTVTLRSFDGASLRSREVTVRRAEDCAACGVNAPLPELRDLEEGRASCRI